MNLWHVGNWCIQIGQRYIESPFEGPSKDVEVLNYAQPFVEALAGLPKAKVVSQPSWELYHLSPKAFAERLRWADVIVFADVETKCLMLHPHFFNRNKWGAKAITFPDRFDLLRGWVAGGGHFHMNGGWLSFGGELGKGGWGRSRFHDVLPVECLQGDDLVESTAGYPVRGVGSHPAAKLDWKKAPPLLGFNETKLREGAECIVEIRHAGAWYPLLASQRYGKGRATAWTTGASPHWGLNFMAWGKYGEFWKRVFAKSSK